MATDEEEEEEEEEIDDSDGPFGTSSSPTYPISTLHKPAPPFKNLHIRTRHQIVADGLTAPLDWSDAGYDMPPDEWHSKILSSATEISEKPPIILDCRNVYETAVGRFLAAEPVNTTNFRDTWSVLEKRLEGVPKDREVMTYCTGGIRCVKVNAYLKQKMGFTNVSRLAGGIVAYDRSLTARRRQPLEETERESLFKGTNYVFDGRVGRMITADKLGDCITCNAKTNGVGNCRNPNCHRRMVQCSDCRKTYDGCCSDGCRDRLKRVASRGMMPPLDDDEATTAAAPTRAVVYPDALSYAAAHSTPPPAIYDEISRNTRRYFRSGEHMLPGPYQYRLLHHYAGQTRFGRVLEVGTFTGYATAALWEGARDVGRLYGVDSKVVSLERDERSLDLASKHLEILERFGFGDDGGGVEAMKRLRTADDEEGRIAWHGEMTDERVTFRCENATCELRRVTDALASIEDMIRRDGEEEEAFDLVFLDADKTRLMEYVDAFLSHDCLLRRGGLMLVDNTLWKGMVYGTRDDEEEEDETRDEMTTTTTTTTTTREERKEERKSRRSRRLAKLMREFNEAILKDERAEVVVLPIRDGLSVVRKR